MRTAFAATLAGLVLAAQALADPSPEQRYSAAVKTLKTACGEVCGLGIGNDPREAQALDALWDATEDWTVARLNAHRRIPRHGTARHNSIVSTTVTQLAPDLYAIAAIVWEQTGTVFLVGKRDGQWQVVWDVRRAQIGPFGALKAWRTDHAGPCTDEEGHDGHYDCGPVYGRVMALTSDRDGRIRFALEATYAQGAEFTVKSQISFWRWDGANAEPLLAETYSHEQDDILRGHDTADTVVVRVKSDYLSLEACGACEGRQLDWTFRALPDRIEDGGKRLVHPEADFVDQVYDRLARHLPVADAATPEALALMANYTPDRGDFVTWPNAQGAQVCLFSDGFDGFDLHFQVVRRASGYFIANATRIPATSNNACVRPAKT